MIGFAGLSHLSIVSGIATASKGFPVVGYDPNENLVGHLNKGELPVFEPGLQELFEESRERITFSINLKDLSLCDVVYVALDVKTDEKNVSDLSALKDLSEKLVQNINPKATLVILSQVPPGFTRKLKNKSGFENLYYQVETLIFGRALERALHPERYIVGCADPKKPLPGSFSTLLGAFDCPVLPMRYESAELAKISINMYLVSSVSVTNTLAEICENVGADWSEIAPSLRLDKRIGPYAYLSPGLGIAGGNLERDLATIKSLSQEFGTDSGIVTAWIENSRYRRDWALRTLHKEYLSQTDSPQVALWGLAYKQDTHSTKNSPALALLEGLKGVPVKAYDPQVVLDRDFQVTTSLLACEGAGALVVMTPWAEFSKVDVKEISKSVKCIVDPFGMINEDQCRALGIKYFKMGKAEAHA